MPFIIKKVKRKFHEWLLIFGLFVFGIWLLLYSLSVLIL